MNGVANETYAHKGSEITTIKNDWHEGCSHERIAAWSENVVVALAQ